MHATRAPPLQTPASAAARAAAAAARAAAARPQPTPAAAHLVKVVGAGHLLLAAGHALRQRHRAHRLVAFDHLGRAAGELLLGGGPVGGWQQQGVASGGVGRAAAAGGSGRGRLCSLPQFAPRFRVPVLSLPAAQDDLHVDGILACASLARHRAGGARQRLGHLLRQVWCVIGGREVGSISCQAATAELSFSEHWAPGGGHSTCSAASILRARTCEVACEQPLCQQVQYRPGRQTSTAGHPGWDNLNRAFELLSCDQDTCTAAPVNPNDEGDVAVGGLLLRSASPAGAGRHASKRRPGRGRRRLGAQLHHRADQRH